jgi:hypothetical protein
MAAALSKVLKRLGPKKVEEMDKAAKKSMFGQPENAGKKEKSVRLTEKEKADMQASLKEKGKAKEKGLTAAEKKSLQEDLAGRKRTLEETEEQYSPAERKALKKKLGEVGRSAMAKGGMSTKKMMGGGMAKNYFKGGMANCGASVKASGSSRNK